MISLLNRQTVALILLCVSVSGRYILEEFDLDAAAAEPRPTVIETDPSAEALPLVHSEDTSARGPLSVASEKVEKYLRPAYSFAYNKEDDDVDIAESKVDEEDKNSEAVEPVDYQDEKDDTKAADSKGETENAGIEAAESKHHGHKDHGGDHAAKFEKAGGKDTHSHHHGEHGEKGDKGYKGHHHHEKGQKGHHDKEDHSKHYDEHGGHKKEHHHEDGYHGDYHKKHGGKKGSKYEEKGEHSKGHTTKGEHNIHKKEEYDKKTEFFEEENEGGESETHGGFKHEGEYEKGGHHKGGHKKGGHHEDHYGKKGESEKGGHYKDEKGHNEKGGHEKHHDHESKHGEKAGHATGKKWAYKKGDGDGGGHGHGAHSHHTYAVQEPPAKSAQIKKHKIKPISTFVLPLEEEIKEESEDKAEDENSESTLQQLVVAKKHRLKNFKPSPVENNNSPSDFPLISLPSDSQAVTKSPQEALTPVSTVERYLTQKTQKDRHYEDEKYDQNKSKRGQEKGKKRAYKKGDRGGGHGEAQSDHTYAVQELLKQEEQAPNEKYEITPISTFVLPLEEEANDKKESEDIEENSKITFEDIKPSSSENNNSDDDLPLILLSSDSHSVTDTPEEALTTISTLERYIRQEMQKLKLEHPTTEQSNLEVTKKLEPVEKNSSEDDLELIALPISDSQIASATISSANRYVRQEMQEHAKPKIEETKKVTKRLRLKKRKIPKACEANLQKREILLIPEGSSDSFVIVAAEDA